MKLRFKHQKFQQDAATAVCDIFAGQPKLTSSYRMDSGIEKLVQEKQYQFEQEDLTGFNNKKLLIPDSTILSNLQAVQRRGQIEPSKNLEGKYNLTIEMETGVGKTYTYIKTMFELSLRYGWNKFIIVVPSIAIREGVFKSFQITQEHFVEDYSKKIRFFVYDSSQLHKLDDYANDSGINVMIINSQAFNARGKDARRIYMKLDSFRSRRPIDVIGATNPIVIIDEPQSVEGPTTKAKLKEFNPLFTLRYSATHKKDSIYNMVYRLDAIEAYNKRLVKKISVKGISLSGTTATERYLYLERINLSSANPTTTIEFEYRGQKGIRKVKRTISEGFNIYDNSGGLEEYKGLVVTSINGATNLVEFTNGVILSPGDIVGTVNKEQIQRIQIRETIQSHIEKERKLFYKGIKVLSLFFIDEVKKYKWYDAAGDEHNGVLAETFLEEYESVLCDMQPEFGEDEYFQYLRTISHEKVHAGYFSIDKKSKHFIDSNGKGKEKVSDDVSAYDLIMNKKELLLDMSHSVRFIFSHSALREGWDNPNVFQICTLKNSGSEVRKRQEVGRGLRLCVDKHGERMDSNVLGGAVHDINMLTVVASESYEKFAEALQKEIAEIVADRPRKVTPELFENKTIVDENGVNPIVIDKEAAASIVYDFIINGYVDRHNELTEKYYKTAEQDELFVAEEYVPYLGSITSILDMIYQPEAITPENERAMNVETKVNLEKLNLKEFKLLWGRINSKSAYVVDFDTDELVKKSINALNSDLTVSEITYKIETGTMHDIKSKQSLQDGTSFKKEKTSTSNLIQSIVNSSVKYDLIGKIVDETTLTRKAVVQILQGIESVRFDQFKRNPEEFILKASNIINEQKATIIIEHITYNKLEEVYDTDVFTEHTLKGRLGINAMKTNKHLFDNLIYDSEVEKKMAENLDISQEVVVYVKLPKGFFINTPVGHYNPDWAVAFNEGSVKHIYFVAETKGDLSSLQLREVELLKKKCATEHFKAISNETVKYSVVDSYEQLLNEVMI